MQHPALISIIIINHNYGRFLGEAIDSALDQSQPAHEVIVVDDGSTDNSRDVIAAYVGRIVPVLRPLAGGHVAAFNDGFATASGQLCLFLDADDKLFNDCVKTVLGVWHDGDVKLQFRLETIDVEGRDCRMTFPYFPPDLTPAAVHKQSVAFGVYPWTVSTGNVYARSYLEALLPIDQAKIARSPDGYLNKMAPLFGDVRSTTEVLGAYRVHGRNAWAQDETDFKPERILRWLAFDRTLEAAFDDAAAAQGVKVRPAIRRNSLQKVEYRLLAFRFARDETPYRGDTRMSLFWLGCRAAWEAPNVSSSGRILWMLWIAALALLPRSMARRCVRNGRSQNRRSSLSRMLLAMVRGSASSSRVGGGAPSG